MIERIESDSPESIEGIYEIVLHSDKRIALPKEWREYFPDTSEIMLFFDGKKCILVSSTYGPPPIGTIVHRVIVKQGRIRPSKAFYKSHQITQPKKLWLIGKGTHFEMHMDEETYQETLKKSQTLVQEFQSKLLRAKGE